jgi:small subunit ribosomal protein S17
MKNVGLSLKPPEKTCNDQMCPFHGSLPVRGILLDGVVISTGAKGMVLVERALVRFSKKYNRYYKIRKKIRARLPECISVQVGDNVKIGECRPLSKTISFVVLEKRGSK